LKEVRKIFFRGSLFMIISAFVYIAVMFILVKIKFHDVPLVYRVSDVITFKGGNTFLKFKDFDKNAKYDVIVLGSSHAYRGYDPRIFKSKNLNMFNLGTSGQSLVNSFFIAKHYITAENCKLVLLDIYDAALSVDGMESTADLMQNLDFPQPALEMGLALKDPRVINMLTVRILKKNDPAMYLDSNYIVSGYSETIDSAGIISKSKYRDAEKINGLQLEYLQKLFDYFKKNRINVVVVSHPYPKEKSLENHLKYFVIVKQLCEEYNFRYMDYSFAHELDSRFNFYDANHLNQSGVEIFNKRLLDDLTKEKVIPLN
jgi:hypothetical protein